MKSELFKTAWYLFRNANNIYKTFSDALKAAWTKVKFKAALKTKVIEFTFKKKDGSIRKAVGKAVENYTSKTNTQGRKKPRSIITYFDLDRESIRSFNVWQLQKS